MGKIMPDLFLVMSDEELEEAISFAREMGANYAKWITAINCDVKINNENIDEYIKKTGSWFPEFSCYIDFPINDDDSIVILLSPTIWKEYDDSLVGKVLRENGIKVDLEYDPLFISPRKLMNWIIDEAAISKKYPINPPWTARDIEVVNTALESIEEINSAVLIANVNFNLQIYLNDFKDNYDCFVIASEVAEKNVIADFLYPNCLQLNTENGIFNVFMGSMIDIRDVLSLVEEKGIDTIIKEYEDDDKELLLYKSRNSELKL